MKQIFFLLMLMFGAVTVVYAQDHGSAKPSSSSPADTAVVLKGVTVEAARVTFRPDGRHIILSVAQRERASNGYALLRLLSLPQLQVDVVHHTIADRLNRGEVQLRINGAIASKSDLMALDPKRVTSIDYIDNPGVRYGQGIAFVIDIHTRRSDAGYELGTDLTQALARYSDDMVYAKVNRGKSEWVLTYNFFYKDNRNKKARTLTDYLLTDGTHDIVSRVDKQHRSRAVGHTVALKYNRTDTLGNVLQAKLTVDFNHCPGDDVRTDVNGTDVKNFSRDRSFSPVLDLYLVRKLGRSQCITANVVGTHIHTRSYNYMDEDGPYAYHVKGNTSSLIGEAIYENRLRPFTLSLGANYQLKYTRNSYTGDVDVVNRLHNQYVYGFAQLKGRLGSLTYVAGLGMSSQRYSQGEAHYNFNLFRPKATLVYDFGHGLSLSYVFEQYGFFSRIAMIGDATIRTNGREWTMGAPNLKPNRCDEHMLRFNYSSSRWNNTLMADYRDHSHCNMAAYFRTDDNRFVYTQRNQRGIKMIYFTDNLSYTIIPDRLVANANGGFFRYFNFGDDYTHLHNFWMVGGSLQAYLGHWTLTVQADNGFRFLEGENLGWNYGMPELQCSYQAGPCSLSVTWDHCFMANPKAMSSHLLNRYMHKDYELRSKTLGNLITLNFTWKLGRGRNYKEAQRKLNNKDTQTGIIGRN